jgi:hypothetical protein
MSTIRKFWYSMSESLQLFGWVKRAIQLSKKGGIYAYLSSAEAYHSGLNGLKWRAACPLGCLTSRRSGGWCGRSPMPTTCRRVTSQRPLVGEVPATREGY